MKTPFGDNALPGSATYAVLSLEVEAPRSEALAGWVRQALGREPVVIERPDRDRAWIDVYFGRDVEALLAGRVAAGRPGVLGQAVRLCRPRDWTTFWRHHFHARPVGTRLAVVPSWERIEARRRWPRRRAIVLDPGLSFGTGDHFTTRFCLEQLDALCAGAAPRSLLDVGTGSGVIAIAAARLGVPVVHATDHDPQVLGRAAANARANRVGRRVRFEAADITRRKPRRTYEVVCANLYGALLVRAAPRLAPAARSRLVLSGLREPEADAVAAAYEAEGFAESVRDGDGAWCGLVLAR